MLKCLICTSAKERYQALKLVILNEFNSEVILSQYKEDIVKKLNKTTMNTLIIDLPFTNDSHEIPFILSQHNRYPNICMILLVNHQDMMTIQEKVEGLGIFIISKPIQKEIFTQFLSFVECCQWHIHKYQSQQKKLLKQITDMKQFYQAKCLLMENEYMSESMAHHYIEKEAMNKRIPKEEVIKSIIKNIDMINNS